MASFTYGDQTFKIPKLKIRELKAAGPFIDNINLKQAKIRRDIAGLSEQDAAAKLMEEGGGITGVNEMMGNLLRVIAIGVLHAKGERPYSVASIEAQAELIEAEIGFDELAVLNTAFEDITSEAGLRPKDPPKPPAAGETEASENGSIAS